VYKNNHRNKLTTPRCNQGCLLAYSQPSPILSALCHNYMHVIVQVVFGTRIWVLERKQKLTDTIHRVPNTTCPIPHEVCLDIPGWGPEIHSSEQTVGLHPHEQLQLHCCPDIEQWISDAENFCNNLFTSRVTIHIPLHLTVSQNTETHRHLFLKVKNLKEFIRMWDGKNYNVVDTITKAIYQMMQDNCNCNKLYNNRRW